MANKKISELSALTTIADADLIEVVDVSDTSMSPNGTNKKITFANLILPENLWDLDGNDLVPRTTGNNVKIENDDPTILLDGTVGNPGGTAQITLNGDITAGGGDSVIQFQDGGSVVGNVGGAGALTLSTAAGIDIQVTAANDLSLDDQYLSSSINLSETGTTGLVGFTATSLVGALNEVKSEITAESLWDRSGTDLRPENNGDTVSLFESAPDARAGSAILGVYGDDPVILIDGAAAGDPGGDTSLIINADIDGGGEGKIVFQSDGVDQATIGWSGGLSINSPDDLQLKDQYLSTSIALSQSGTTGLTGFTATSIVGALNEVKSEVTAEDLWDRDAGNGYTYTKNAGDKVGVGTSAPDQQMHLVAQGVSDEEYLLMTGTNVGVIKLGYNGADSIIDMDPFGDGGGFKLISSDLGNDYITVDASQNLLLDTSADLSFNDQYLSSAITISESGTTGLSGFTATSIVGALNELETEKLDKTLSVEAFTANDTLTAAESGKMCTNEGAAGAIELTLPTAAAGITYTFYVQAAQYLRINASAGDTIRNAGTESAAAGYFRANVVGNLIRITAVNATEWVTESIVGTWSVDA